MSKGQQFAKTMRYTLSIGTRTRRFAAHRDLHAEILDAINETNLYPGCRNEETEAIFRTALAAYWSHQKHIAGYRVDCRLVAHINAMSPWQFCNLLGRMIDADITNVGEGELFYAELRAELFAPAAPTVETHNEEETNVTEFGVFEDSACIEAGFHGETGKAAAEEHAASLVAAYPEMIDAYEILEICPDHNEQAKRDCEECATDGNEDLGPGFCMECGEPFETTAALDAHQDETGHETDQPDHPLNSAAALEPAEVANEPEVPTTGETFTPVGFHDVHEGDRVQFVSANNGFDGGDDAWRTGTVRKVTDKTVTVDCDSNSFGKVARLRRADWHYRCVSKSTKQPERRPYRAESVQIVDMGHTVWALYIPDPEQAKDPRHVAENILDRSKYNDVEMIATMTRQYKRDGGAVSGWTVEGDGGWGDGTPNKRQAMLGLRAVIRDHFTR